MGYVKKIKVLMLDENLPVPADRRVWNEATTLQQHGFQVSVICPKGATNYRESHVCIDGVHIYRYSLPTTGNKSTSYMKEYSVALLMTFLLSIKVLLRHGFDVLHAANPPDMFFLLGLFYRVLGKKYIFDQHDLAPEMFSVKFKGKMKLVRRVLLLLERCSYQVAHRVIVTNHTQKWIATQRGGCSPDKVLIVRNGPDLRRLKRVAPEADLKGGRAHLLAYVGVMGSQDGIEYALQALHHLVYKRGRQDVSLVLMGNGDHLPFLQALAHQLRLDDYVNFKGWVENSEIVRYLSVADIGISPDPQNGLNEFSTMIKTMEYMAMSLPVVAFDLTETRYSAQGAALYATPNVVKNFADNIERLLDDAELRRTLGVCGRRRIEQELSWHTSTLYLLLTYQRLFPDSVELPDEVVEYVETTSEERVAVHP
ncbi:MAG TPA: glycosyltransferase family 4 protein [Ktedonobacteraceae bacterium]|nr:glycosyltransferase family 4 protein [Ktedonobacteraceae bacterium]